MSLKGNTTTQAAEGKTLEGEEVVYNLPTASSIYISTPITGSLSKGELKERFFDKIDSDKIGIINLEKIAAVAMSAGCEMSQGNLNAAMTALDCTADISFEKFTAPSSSGRVGSAGSASAGAAGGPGEPSPSGASDAASTAAALAAAAAPFFKYFWISDSCPETAAAVRGVKPFEVLSLADAIAATLRI